MTRLLRRGILLVTTMLLVGAPLLAAEAEHAAGPDTFLGLPRWLFLTLNLVVFLGVLAWAAGPAVVRFLEDKQREIAHALAEAERQREEAATMEARIAAQIEALHREVDELAGRSIREGERERDEILVEAGRECERIRASVHAEIEQSLRQARQELTAHAARLAADLAGQRLESGLTREDKKRLFRDNLERLERKEA